MPYYDAYTTSTFQATYGRAMTVFTTTDVNASQYPQEMAFLSGLMGTFTTAIMHFVRQTYPMQSSRFCIRQTPMIRRSIRR